MCRWCRGRSPYRRAAHTNVNGRCRCSENRSEVPHFRRVTCALLHNTRLHHAIDVISNAYKVIVFIQTSVLFSLTLYSSYDMLLRHSVDVVLHRGGLANTSVYNGSTTRRRNCSRTDTRLISQAISLLVATNTLVSVTIDIPHDSPLRSVLHMPYV